jgi:two-component system, LytTR family, response regulator
MKKIRTLIIDDMPLSRARMQRFLANYDDIEIVAECDSAKAALIALAQCKSDVVFLDVQMPGMSGLAMLERLPADQRPAVVFVTAFEEFAVSAFAAGAVDYLLKPFDLERLAQALTKVRTYLRHVEIERGAKGAGGEEAETCVDRIPVKSGGCIVFVQVGAIDWVEAAGNYLSLHCGKETHTIRETMAEMEATLDPRKFVRIHRSALVRVDAIKEIRPLPNGDRTITLLEGTKLTLSRSYRERTKAILGDL